MHRVTHHDRAVCAPGFFFGFGASFGFQPRGG
jgi:hypothetical protein